MKLEVTASKNNFNVTKEQRTAPGFIENRKNDLAVIEFTIVDAGKVKVAKCSLTETIHEGAINTDLYISGVPRIQLENVITELKKSCWGYTGFCEITQQDSAPILTIHLSEMYECFIPPLWQALDTKLHFPLDLEPEINERRYKKVFLNEQDQQYQELCNVFETAGKEQARQFVESKSIILFSCLGAIADTHTYLKECHKATADTEPPTSKRQRVFSVGEEEELTSPRARAFYRRTDSPQ